MVKVVVEVLEILVTMVKQEEQLLLEVIVFLVTAGQKGNGNPGNPAILETAGSGGQG